jgi:hypothetical protein
MSSPSESRSNRPNLPRGSADEINRQETIMIVHDPIMLQDGVAK